MKGAGRVLLILCCITLLPWTFAQTSPVPDTLQQQVGELFKTEQYDAMITLLVPVQEAARRGGQWERYCYATAELCRAWVKQDDMNSALKQVEMALANLAAAGQAHTVGAAKLYNWQAIILRKQQRFAETLAAYQTAIRLFEQSGFQGEQLIYAYRNAAQIHMRYSDNGQAIELLEAALRIDTSGEQRALIFSQLSGAYFFLDSLSAADHYYRQGLQVARISPHHAALLATAGAALALKREDLETAQRLTLESLLYYAAQTSGIDNSLRAYTTLADIAARRGQLPQAVDWFQKAEHLGQTRPGKSREMAILYLAWGDFWEKNGSLQTALNLYQKAIIQVFPGFNEPDPAFNPLPGDAYLEAQAMFALARKGAALLKKAAPEVADRVNAADCFELSFAVAAKLRQTYGDDADKLSLAGENRGYQRLAALNLWRLWQHQPDPATLDRLLRLFEQSKAQALTDAVRQQHALTLSGIPDSLLRRETTLRLTAADKTVALKEEELREHTGDLLPVHQDAAFRAERAYADFLTDLARTYPQFQQLATAERPLNPAALRAALPDTTALLSWFDAGDRYLCLVARRAGLTAYEVPRDSFFDRQLTHFLARLADKSAQENAPDDFFAAAFALGQRLLAADQTGAARALIIVPDGRLCYLPFEALLTAPHRGSYGSAPYVLRTHTVRYAWSAGLLNTPTAARQAAEKGFLQVAPFVENARDGLAILPDSRRERPAGGSVDALIGPAAQTDAFLKKALTYQVLQLSTHAHAGGQTTPGIELYDRTLTLPEIYAQRFPATLVALSACETGAGEYADGEGVLSLARAFAYAGAQSLLASHWSVNERSTAELFIRFYEKLEQGAPRAEALRQAKLDWLNGPEPDARKAPWHWAAFTLSGADGPVDWTNRTPGWLWGLLALAGLGLGALFVRRLFRRAP